MDIFKEFSKLMNEKYHSKGIYPTLSPFGSGKPCFEMEARITTKAGLSRGTSLQIRRGGYEDEEYDTAYKCLLDSTDIILKECSPEDECDEFFEGYSEGWQYEQGRAYFGEEPSADFLRGHEVKKKVDAYVKSYAKKYNFK